MKGKEKNKKKKIKQKQNRKLLTQTLPLFWATSVLGGYIEVVFGPLKQVSCCIIVRRTNHGMVMFLMYMLPRLPLTCS
jgi:lipid-A-disaccharide synthase-like uncharacterized protein